MSSKRSCSRLLYKFLFIMGPKAEHDAMGRGKKSATD